MSEKQYWGSRIGVVLAVAGSAVGLGNFLRFPGQAAQNGAGAFMIPYFIALLVVGIPLAWAEWSMGRYAGTRGFHSTPGIFAALCRKKYGALLGVFALLIPFMVYTYYVIIEAWCLGYAFQYLTGGLAKDPAQANQFSEFFGKFTGGSGVGAALDTSSTPLLYFVVFTFFLNFSLIILGLNKGIEIVCKIAMPLMIFCAVCVLIRVLTLGSNPEWAGESVAKGLNFMWEPDFNKLLVPQTWLAAAGQIFFSLSVGFGVIVNYASYLRRKEDIALSGLTSSTTNEFFEVCLGGLITLPAAFIFLGAAAGSFGTFGMGFIALPDVFALMPGGRFFGFLWYFMLFLAALTSSISMLQPVSAFIQEGLGVNRLTAATVLAVMAGFGCAFTMYYTTDAMAMDTIDFWCGTFLIVVLALGQSLVYGWVFGIERGHAELQRGALIPVPKFVSYMLKYVTPVFLIAILAGTVFSGGSYYDRLLRTHDIVAPSAANISSMDHIKNKTIGIVNSVKLNEFDDLENGIVVRDFSTFEEAMSALRESHVEALYASRADILKETDGARDSEFVLMNYELDSIARRAVVMILGAIAILLIMICIAVYRWSRMGKFAAFDKPID
ncbi:MAG TPA: sodium-dependent transporter [Pirellulaceae bacterium]|nr:sodium-dependent transporter [Pirellulaceae bacterium]HMO92685.1 sodium-dependent transporter [Pirellulaceae bacterium]HMP70567.1 sodium-dependent transporter [Pirellulaceae bacterium]